MPSSGAWSTLLGLRKTGRIRREVCATLHPLLAPGRDAISRPSETWDTPYRLGLLCTTINQLVSRADASLTDDVTGLLQLEIWAALTGEPSDLLGQRLLSLSMTADSEFLRGCANGLAFVAELRPWRDTSETERAALLTFWQGFSDA